MSINTNKQLLNIIDNLININSANYDQSGGNLSFNMNFIY